MRRKHRAHLYCALAFVPATFTPFQRTSSRARALNAQNACFPVLTSVAILPCETDARPIVRVFNTGGPSSCVLHHHGTRNGVYSTIHRKTVVIQCGICNGKLLHQLSRARVSAGISHRLLNSGSRFNLHPIHMHQKCEHVISVKSSA